MIKKVTPFFVLIMVIALILYWLKVDQRALGLFTLLIIISSVQLYSAWIYSYEPLVRFLLVTISVGGIGVALIGLLGEVKAFPFFTIQPLIYAYFTKDPNLQVKWKPNNT
jgi:hypothetical protein